MHLLGIFSYPAHWRRRVWAVSLLNILIIVEGIGSLAWLMAHPSELESRVFLAYSLERWLLILILAILIFAFSFSLWAIKSRSERVQRLIEFFQQPKQAYWLLIAVTFLFILITGLMLWLPHVSNARPYLMRLLPLLLWGTAIVVQIWLLLMVLMWQRVSHFFKEFFPINRKKQMYPVKTMGRSLLAVLIFISLGYLFIQFRSYLAVREAILIGDSWSYLHGANLDISDPDFFSERRPWAILLFFKLLGNSQPLIGIFQLSISTVAWLFLAWKFIDSIKIGWIKISGFILILGFSLSPTVQVWNYAVLSESLSISVMVVIIALFIGLAQKWEWRSLLLLMLCFVIWMSLREANAYIAVMVAFALVVIGFMQRTLKVYWVLSFLIGVSFLINYQLSAAYALPRWALPLAEVITKRILPEPEYLNFFASNGMPVTPELMALSGRWAISDGYAVVNNTKLGKFEKWLYTEGRNVYIKFLLTHPSYTIDSPLENIEVLLADDYFERIPVPKYTPALPKVANEILYPERYFRLYLWLSLFVSGFIFAVSLRENKKVYWVVFFTLLLAIPHLYLIWHGDALDVARHAVIANVQFHLSVWLLIILYLDGVFGKPKSVSFSGS